MSPVFTLILCIPTVLVVMVLVATLKIVRQQQVAIVERLGRFRRVLGPGPCLMVSFLDRVRCIFDMHEEVVPSSPQGVTTEGNPIVSIDSVICSQIVDPVQAAYGAQNYHATVGQPTMATLRNIIGSMDLETTLTLRGEINNRLYAAPDEATGKWGIKVSRVKLRAIEPSPITRDAVEKGAHAGCDKRASILLTKGQRQSQILFADGDWGAAIPRTQGGREVAVSRVQADRQAQMLRAEGETQAITTVFSAIHIAEPDQALLAYQYMQMLPRLVNDDSNKMWIALSELSDALKDLRQVANSTDVRDYVSRTSQCFSVPELVGVHIEIAERARKDHGQSNATAKQTIADTQAMEGTGSNRRLEQPSPRPQRQDLGSPGAWGPRLGGPYDTQ